MQRDADRPTVAIATAREATADAQSAAGVRAPSARPAAVRPPANSDELDRAPALDRRHHAESLLASENRVLAHIASGAPLDVVAPALCTAIEELAPGARCAIRLTPGNVRIPAPFPPAITLDPPCLPGVHLFGSMTAIGMVPPLVGARRIVPSVSRDAARRALRRRGVASYWVEPIVAANGDLLGVLAAYRSHEGAPSTHDLECAVAVARLAGIAIERARLDERGREHQAQLAHVARLATMGEMASGLAHELNQPLCAIVNYAEASIELLASQGSADELRRALIEVARQAERAGEVIRRLREFVRWRELRREPVDINHVVREVVGFTAAELRQRGIAVRLALAPVLPRALGDAVQLQQVLINLIRNACDAMSTTDAPRRLTIRTARAGGMVDVAVSDAGPGLPEDGGEHWFEPFFTTKGDGMGMGLSISRSIVEAHGGRIGAVSNRTRGATIRFTIPAAPRRPNGRATDRVRGG
ncbi:MAG: ATP-binding protein [Phycisphaerae bacterium]